MEEIQLKVGEEQSINIGDYLFYFHFDPFNREWQFDMSDLTGNNIYTNMVIRINTCPFYDISNKYGYPNIVLIDKEPDSKEEINPLLDFGDRIGLFEIMEV